ncbi:Glycosyl hydrolases family 39 [Izhakiella capsodis]|uniref:Glycosyl hydrolases family 39 n=1 Tax=Izhakiella capsodis TaxID=1367852 RepID=A0A1I4X4F2_9GAMM|nr:hypothetical protein [Izhakiella capsodis]SFN20373.1 Glycosyl hydrolases family 39 [Izhakiella capsodis]
MKLISFDTLTVDSNAGKQGKLKEINGVNGTPKSIAPGLPNLDNEFNQLGIRYLRFHDNLGIGDLDNYFVENDQGSQFIPNIPSNYLKSALKLISSIGNIRTIFPNAAAGMRSNNAELALKDANYAMTDQHFIEVLSNNSNPKVQRDILFRVGRTNRGSNELPQNFDIYATLVDALVKRYSLNYDAVGLPRKIIYWEIWNEPDLPQFWNSNNPQDYYEFYAKIAKKIKSIDPSAKVGGAGVANGYNPGGAYIEGLLQYCRNNNVPIDFVSWHYYGNSTSDPQNIITIGNQIQNTLRKYKYDDIESICSEWNSTPFAHKNIFSKLQSAKNAAYIASTLIYMQYTKVDLAHYYRGDASSFGLFNNSGHFFTYSAQAFHMFSRLLETPDIISGNKDFSSGLSVIACKSSAGNKINILAANYVVDRDFSTANPPKESPLYPQHYVDGNRQIEQLTDDVSKKEWFGNVDPTTIHPDNYVPPKGTVRQLPVHGVLNAVSRDYKSSNNGLSIQLSNMRYNSCKLTAYRIKEGGNLDSVLAPDITNEVTFRFENNDLIIDDSGAKTSTVTFYSLELSNVTSRPKPNPVPVNRKATYIYTMKRGVYVSHWPSNQDFYVNAGEVVYFKYTNNNYNCRLFRLRKNNYAALVRARNTASNIVEGSLKFNQSGHLRSALIGKLDFIIYYRFFSKRSSTGELTFYIK